MRVSPCGEPGALDGLETGPSAVESVISVVIIVVETACCCGMTDVTGTIIVELTSSLVI